MSQVAVVIAKDESQAREIMAARFGAVESQIANMHEAFSYYADEGIISSIDDELGEKLTNFTAVSDAGGQMFVFAAIVD